MIMLAVILPELRALSSSRTMELSASSHLLAGSTWALGGVARRGVLGRFHLHPAAARLRGGCEGEHETGGMETDNSCSAGTGDASPNAGMEQASELLERVNLELGETEALMKEKEAADANCKELRQAQERARAELTIRSAALLRAAAKAGDVQSVKEALEKGADPKLADEDGMNALHHAAAWGHIDVIGLLLSHDLSVIFSKATDGSSALHLAAYYGFHAATEKLLECGADVHSEDAVSLRPELCYSPAHMACLRRYTDSVHTYCRKAPRRYTTLPTRETARLLACCSRPART